MRICLAIVGYAGWGRLTAFETSSRDETISVFVLTGLGAGGGVVSTCTITGPVPPPVQVGHAVELSNWGPAAFTMFRPIRAFGGAGGINTGAVLTAAGGV